MPLDRRVSAHEAPMLGRLGVFTLLPQLEREAVRLRVAPARVKYRLIRDIM